MSEHPTGDRRSTSRRPRSCPAPSEYARLTAYAEEFARLLALHDSTPPRWQYFHAHLLCLYARGMVTGQTVSAVRNFVAEADQECVQKAITAEEEPASHSH
jgi:hypothetical protein